MKNSPEKDLKVRGWFKAGTTRGRLGDLRGPQTNVTTYAHSEHPQDRIHISPKHWMHSKKFGGYQSGGEHNPSAVSRNHIPLTTYLDTALKQKQNIGEAMSTGHEAAVNLLKSRGWKKTKTHTGPHIDKCHWPKPGERESIDTYSHPDHPDHKIAVAPSGWSHDHTKNGVTLMTSQAHDQTPKRLEQHMDAKMKKSELPFDGPTTKTGPITQKQGMSLAKRLAERGRLAQVAKKAATNESTELTELSKGLLNRYKKEANKDSNKSFRKAEAKGENYSSSKDPDALHWMKRRAGIDRATSKAHSRNFSKGTVFGAVKVKATNESVNEGKIKQQAITSANLADNIIGADAVKKHKDGTHTIARSFFYKHGSTSEDHADRISKQLNNLGIKHSIVDHSTHDYIPFKGGASVFNQCRHEVKVRIHPGQKMPVYESVNEDNITEKHETMADWRRAAEKLKAREQAQAQKKEQAKADSAKRREERKGRLENAHHRLAVEISSAIANHYPDTDGFDSAHRAVRRLQHAGHLPWSNRKQPIDHMNTAIRKHPHMFDGAKTYSDAVDNFHKAYKADNPDIKEDNIAEVSSAWVRAKTADALKADYPAVGSGKSLSRAKIERAMNFRDAAHAKDMEKDSYNAPGTQDQARDHRKYTLKTLAPTLRRIQKKATNA